MADITQRPALAEATRDAVERFLRDGERRRLAPDTLEAYQTVLRRLARELHVPLLAASREDLAAWLDGQGIAPRSRLYYTTLLRTFYRWCLDEEVIERSPAARLLRPRVARLVPRPIAEADLERALQAAKPRMKAWLALAAYQGLRVKEIAGLRREDMLDMVEPPVLVVSFSKGDRQRVLPLNPFAAQALRLYGMPTTGYFWHGGRGREHLAPETVTKKVTIFFRSLGIDATAHQLRHYFGSEVYRRTRDLRLTQEMLGHASPNTTAIYTAFSPGAAVDVVAGLGPEVPRPPPQAVAVSALPIAGQMELVFAAREPAPAPPPAPELVQVRADFQRAQLADGVAPGKLRNRVNLLIRVESELMPTVTLGATTEQLADFLTRHTAHNRGLQHHYSWHLRAFFRWATGEGLIGADPTVTLTAEMRRRRADDSDSA